MKVSGQPHASAVLPPRNGSRYPLDRRLGGPQSRSGRRGEEEILDLTGILTPTPSVVQPVASRYTDWAIPAHSYKGESVNMSQMEVKQSCVSLGSSTVQLYDSLGKRRTYPCSVADFSSKYGDNSWECTTVELGSALRFLWANRLNAKGIHKEMFPVHGWTSLSCQAIHTWVGKYSQGHSKVAHGGRPVLKWFRQQS
jgi:hypothetical protein